LFWLMPLALVAAPLQATGVPGFTHRSWTPEQGAPGNVVGLAQTPDGYLWLASAEGLFRFDGLTFERIPPPSKDRFTSAIPISVFVDRAGNLWVGYNQNAGPAIYRRGRLQAVPMQAPPPVVMHFAQTADGVLWASWGGQGDRLFRYLRGRWRVMDRALGLPPGEIASLVVTPDDSLWVSLGRSREAGTLARLERGSTRFRVEPDRVGFTTLARGTDGALWISDQTGTRMIRDARGQSPRSPVRYPVVAGAAVPTLAFDRRGGIWGTTRGVGLFRIETSAPTRVERLEAGRLLTADATTEVLTDREGSIWVATDAGLDRYRPAPIARSKGIATDVQDGLKLAQDESGAVFVAAAHKLHIVSTGGSPRLLKSNLGRIGALCEAPGHGVWAVHGGTIARYGRMAATYRLPPDPVIPTICAQDRLGRLWVNGEKHIWVREQQGWRQHPVNLQGRSALDMVPDPTGPGVLVNTGTSTLLRLAGPAQAPEAVTLGIGALSSLWVAGDAAYASAARGLARIATGSVQRIDAGRNTWVVGVRGMALGAEGEAWFLARRGIVKVAAPDLERGFGARGAAVPHRVFDAADGYDTRDQALSFRGAQVAATADGRVFFATRAGTLFVDPTRVVRNTVPPPVTIRSVSANKDSWRDPRDTLLMPAGTRTLRIAFAVNSLAVPARNRAFYRLEGQDSDWTAAGDRREATYTNLGPGRYRFHVIAANSDGAWNRTGSAIAIEIPPTFVQSQSFKLICGVALAVLLWLAYRVHLTFLARRIRSRLLDRLRERERVARDIHDTLLQSIQALMLRFQIAMDGLPEGEPARRGLEDAMDRADEVVAEGRDRLRDLRHGVGLEDPEAALRDIAGRQLAGTAIIATVRSTGSVRSLEPVAWDELASIAAEVMFNIARHAHASEMMADIQYGAANMTLRISDNGIGISPQVASEGRRGHFGIPGMRERAARIGGNLKIGPRCEGGTEVTMTVPAVMVYRPG
jgi:signal transduction histidine kinase